MRQGHASPLDHRRAGILLHPISLPGNGVNGSLGREAYRFVDFLAASHISVWQTLPLGPTHEDRSPYQCLSVHAGNPLLINLDALVERGWLKALPPYTPDEAPLAYQQRYLNRAHQAFQAHCQIHEREEYEQFCAEQVWWLEDYVLYRAIRQQQQHQSWLHWPAALRDREPSALEKVRQQSAQEIAQGRFEQFLFYTQWLDLKHHANRQGILLFGDIPIFVAHDSADVWAQRQYFTLDESGRSTVVAGVPPDYFSATGQLWGNPHYRWDVMAGDGFRWWLDRLRSQFEFFDILRIDHFRGFEAYWEVPAQAETAMGGHWVKAPGEALFKAVEEAFGALPLVAEDLGVITPEVDALRRRFNLPGMKILQFAFDSDAANPYLPHHHEKNSVVYTGTHDNNTTLGWFETLSPEVQARVLDYLGQPAEPLPWPLIRSAFASVAQLAMVPLQDVLALGGESRMNTPGTVTGNWQWRFDWQQVPAELAQQLRQLTALYGRG